MGVRARAGRTDRREGSPWPKPGGPGASHRRRGNASRARQKPHERSAPGAVGRKRRAPRASDGVRRQEVLRLRHAGTVPPVPAVPP